MSDVTPLNTPRPPKHPHMTITTFNDEGSYLPGAICNIVVKADLPADLSVDLPPTPPNASWDIYYGMYLATI